MMIQEMDRQDSIDLVTRTRVSRLACVHEGQPYITPVTCAYGDNCLYSFSRLGQKIAWMRANPLVCVEFDEFVSEQNWASVVVLGKYEELTNTPKYEDLRKRAHELLQKWPMWWEPGCATTLLHEKKSPTEFAYFRIHIDQISGRRGMSDVSSREMPIRHAGPADWLRRILTRPERSSSTTHGAKHH